LETVPGSYEIFVEAPNGEMRVYVGKGDEARMRESEKRHMKEGYSVTGSKWEAADSHREAFKDEDRKMVQHGGAVRSKSPNLTNRINSPGKRYREIDNAGN
jgi:hypothetical protein